MDHSCHKCGHMNEEGRPFCLQCGAPLIRVAMPEAVAEAASLAQASDLSSSGAQLGSLTSSLHGRLPLLAQPCLLAAGVSVILIFVGLNPFAAALGAGFLAIAFSRRGMSDGAMRSGTGMRLGAFSGLLLFGMAGILETVAVLATHKGAEIRSQLLEKVQQTAAHYPGPDIQPFLDFVKTPGGLTCMIIASLIFGMIAFVLLGSLGGAIGAALFGRRNRL
jgi:hypothetical protein